LQFQLVDQGVLPLLIERLQSSNEGVVSMAARAINNIADSGKLIVAKQKCFC
jgi:hypothetical protein